uniref:WAP domain-containing protein n=1 Tax=Paramormyrops kingsleyae TaxID=1676925 RepID=A0A3B3QCF8_9TELE
TSSPSFRVVYTTLEDRTAEFTAKPGHCPATQTGISGPRCKWDTDCPGWQKCCEANGYFYCASPVANSVISVPGHPSPGEFKCHQDPHLGPSPGQRDCELRDRVLSG